VELPIDIQYASTEVQVGEPHETYEVPIDPVKLGSAVDMLSSATKRVIVAGGGVNHAGAAEELVALAQALDAPVFTTENGRGSIADDHALSMGPHLYAPQTAEAIKDADVVLAIGTWFRVRAAANPLPGKLIHMDVDPQSIGLNYKADIELICDAKLGLQALLDNMNPQPGDSAFGNAAQAASGEVKARIRKRIGPDMETIMDFIREGLPRKGIFVRDMTQPAYNWGNPLFPILDSRTTMNPTTGAIGPGLPLANGAAIGTGQKTVVIHGDGGFMVHIGELATAVQYNVPLIICVFTDGGYGVLRGIQSNTFDGRTTGVNLATPNFVTVATGMGMAALRVAGIDQFKSAFTQALGHDGPILLDIDMSKLTPMAGTIIEEFSQPE
jgi:acetolactate synthase-1/2/3 large subunit